MLAKVPETITVTEAVEISAKALTVGEERFKQADALLRQGKTNEALVKLSQARDLDAGNWRIRKQIWALEHPDRFYGTNGIDWDWQKEQIAREKK